MPGSKLDIVSQFMPWHAAYQAIQDFLDEDDISNKWRESKISQLTVVNITAALVAGVVSSTFSWPTIGDAPWTAKALFYSTLILSLASIATGSQQSIVLYRLGAHEGGLKALRTLLSKPATGNDSEKNELKKNTEASKIQLYTWQMPTMLLSLSILLFLIGLIIIIWDRAVQQPSWNDDMKIAFLYLFSWILCPSQLYIGHFLHISSGYVWGRR